jgi:hypothetical protein
MIGRLNSLVGSNKPDWVRRYGTVNPIIGPENPTTLFVPGTKRYSAIEHYLISLK